MARYEATFSSVFKVEEGRIPMRDDLEDVPSKSLEEYWAIVRRRRWWIFLPLFVCWALVWAVSWFLADDLSIGSSHPGGTATGSRNNMSFRT